MENFDCQCIAKPGTYEERKARREAEINGLKDVLEALGSEAAFVQVSPKHLRGVRKRAYESKLENMPVDDEEAKKHDDWTDEKRIVDA